MEASRAARCGESPLRRCRRDGVPTLAGTRAPLSIRLMTTPALGAVLRRLVPPSPASFKRLARTVGEGETIGAHPDLIDLVVAVAGTRSPRGPRGRSSGR